MSANTDEEWQQSDVYAVTEVVGSSPTSVEHAIEVAISTASRHLRNLSWFEVVETRGHIDDGKAARYQVVVKLGFRYEEEAR